MEFLRETIPNLPEALRVLEIGSLDINGSARVLFGPGVEYVGIDRRYGRGVNWMVDARYFHGWCQFDIVITTETLEHEAEPEEIVNCAHRSLRHGGYLVLTTGAPGRPPHGCDGEPVGDSHFSTFNEEQMRQLLDGWEDIIITGDVEHCDTYAVAWKSLD